MHCVDYKALMGTATAV